MKDVLAWTAAIGAMAVEGNGKKSTDRMVEEGLKLDSVAFSHGGFVK